jgi:hypothetical protein
MADNGLARVEFKFNPGILVESFQRQTRAAIDDVLVDVAAELERRSPVGATKGLSQGWDIIPAARRRNQGEVLGSIVNKAPRSINRIVGRPGGRRPPIGPIKAWVLAKINPGDDKKATSIAFLIARKIGKEGTKRFKDQDNFAGLNRDGSFKSGGLLDKAVKEMSANLEKIKIVK